MTLPLGTRAEDPKAIADNDRVAAKLREGLLAVLATL